MHADRPQAPGYLANLMARLFHEVAGEGLQPLGIRPEHFPLLAALWYGAGELSLSEFEIHCEADSATVDCWVRDMVADGLLEAFPPDRHEKLILTARATAARDDAVSAAFRANQAAITVLSDAEMAQFLTMMNKVIDALQREKQGPPLG